MPDSAAVPQSGSAKWLQVNAIRRVSLGLSPAELPWPAGSSWAGPGGVRRDWVGPHFPWPRRGAAPRASGVSAGLRASPASAIPVRKKRGKIPQEEMLDLDEANDSEEVKGLRRRVCVSVSLGLRGLAGAGQEGAERLREDGASRRRGGV